MDLVLDEVIGLIAAADAGGLHLRVGLLGAGWLARAT